MKVTIDIDIDKARKGIEISTGDSKRAREMTEEEVINQVVKHMKSYGVSKED